VNGVYWFCMDLFRLITYEYIKDSTAVFNDYIQTFKLHNLTGHMLRSVVYRERVQLDCRLFFPNFCSYTSTDHKLRSFPFCTGRGTLYNTREKEREIQHTALVYCSG